jgi:hypothetical protein
MLSVQRRPFSITVPRPGQTPDWVNQPSNKLSALPHDTTQ